MDNMFLAAFAGSLSLILAFPRLILSTAFFLADFLFEGDKINTKRDTLDCECSREPDEVRCCAVN